MSLYTGQVLEVRLRIGRSDDTRFIAEMMLRAGGGLFEQLLDDIVPGIGAEPLLALALAINQAECAFGYDNAILAHRGDRRCGMALCFPATEHRLPEAVTAIVPPQRLARIEALIASSPRDSFYLHSIAVPAGEERRGIGSRMLHAAAELAAAHGLPRLALHVWQGNAAARAFYARYGFETGPPVDLAGWAGLRWAGPAIPLTVDTADLLARFAANPRISV